MGLIIKFFDIMAVWWFTEKSDFYGGFTKYQYIAGNYLKSRPVQFAELT